MLGPGTMYPQRRWMTTSKSMDPWPRIRTVATAFVRGLRAGQFAEETVEALCRALGATGAWTTLEAKGSGTRPIERAFSRAFAVASPAVIAEHAHEVLDEVQRRRRMVAGPVPYSSEGSFAAFPLWTVPRHPKGVARMQGAIYLDFPQQQGTEAAVLEFLDCVASLLATITTQQLWLDDARETLREQQATQDPSPSLDLSELLAPRSMRAIRDEVRAAVRSRASIVILGESGTGKTQLATAIARAGNRTPIVRATLGFSDDLNTITSELFGHERGSFSGAAAKRRGMVEFADKGTLILDEILNLPPHAQQLLLDFTQFGTYRPLGYQGVEPKRADVRLIAVTNGDIKKAIRNMRFRQDLYFRLATVPLTLPPLRDRRQDIPDIALGYLRRTGEDTSWSFDDEALSMLLGQHIGWAGNIRELEAVLERARNRALAEDASAAVIRGKHLDLPAPATSRPEQDAPGAARSEPPPTGAVRERWEDLAVRRAELDAVEREIIRDALRKCNGVVAHTAKELSLSRTSLISRMAVLDINPRAKDSERAG